MFVDEITLDAAASRRRSGKRPSPSPSVPTGRGRILTRSEKPKSASCGPRKLLYLRFECRYRELFVFEDSDSNGRRDHLWDRDVAEAFLQPDPSRERYYREFEVSPNGMWIDLDIFPGGLADLKSGMKRSVFLDEKAQRWAAELAIPMKALTTNFDPKAVWRANFYRVEGKEEPRAYLAWRPTGTPEPNFHVPAAFGRLRFAGRR